MGDTSGTVFRATSVIEDPSRPTVKIAHRSISQLAKAIRVPSRRQLGSPWPPGGAPARVSGCTRPLDTFTIESEDGGYASNAIPPRSAGALVWKSISSPSGDQAGLDPDEVTARAAPPPEGTTRRPPRRADA